MGSELDWIASHVRVVGSVEWVHERPWGRVARVPLARGAAWFKACGSIQAFEPRLTALLATRWPDHMPRVLAHDEERAWLLLEDAGRAVGDIGNPPEAWLAVLPSYAELQRGRPRMRPITLPTACRTCA